MRTGSGPSFLRVANGGRTHSDGRALQAASTAPQNIKARGRTSNANCGTRTHLQQGSFLCKAKMSGFKCVRIFLCNTRRALLISLHVSPVALCGYRLDPTHRVGPQRRARSIVQLDLCLMTQRASSDLSVFCGAQCESRRRGVCPVDGRPLRSADVGCIECANGVTRFVKCDARERSKPCAYVVFDKAGQSASRFARMRRRRHDVRDREGPCVKCCAGHRLAHTAQGAVVAPTCVACGPHCMLCDAVACDAGFVFDDARTGCVAAKGTSFRECGSRTFLKDGV